MIRERAAKNLMNELIWHRCSAAALGAESALGSAWDVLSAERLDLPFLCADAVIAALDVFGNKEEQLLVGKIAGRVCAMFVMVPAGSLQWRTFQPSQLPLGCWVAAQSLELSAIARSLMRGPLGICLAVSITQVDPLQAPREFDASDSRIDDYIDTAWVDITGSFDEYWATRGKNLRQNMRKQRNKLASEGTPTLLRIISEEADIANALKRYGALESAGWKANQGTAISITNDQGHFYSRLFQDAAARGEARIYEYLLGDRTAAMNLCLLRGNVLVVLKTAYDETISKTLSPAFLLREEEMQRIFSSAEIRRIEYYGKVMEWHTKLTEKRRTLYHLTVFRWPILKQLASRRRMRELSATEKALDIESQKARAE